MMLVPTPWYLVPSTADVLGPAGVPISVARLGYPADLTALTLRCVYTEAELFARALIILTDTLGPLVPVSE